MSKYRKEISQQEFEEIEKYLTGQIDVAEQAAFERRMAEDNVLRDEVTLQRQLIGTVETAAFKATNEISEGYTIPAAKKIMRYWRYAAAAVLLLGVGITGWWLYSSKIISPKDLYTAYFRPDPGLPTVMSSDTVLYNFNKGMILYKEENYGAAIGVWEKLIAQKGVTDTLAYYIGVSSISTDSLVKAQTYLAPITSNTNSVFQQKAIWYLALLKLKVSDYTGVRNLLIQLPDKESAIELLKKIPE